MFARSLDDLVKVRSSRIDVLLSNVNVGRSEHRVNRYSELQDSAVPLRLHLEFFPHAVVPEAVLGSSFVLSMIQRVMERLISKILFNGFKSRSCGSDATYERTSYAYSPP